MPVYQSTTADSLSSSSNIISSVNLYFIASCAFIQVSLFISPISSLNCIPVFRAYALAIDLFQPLRTSTLRSSSLLSTSAADQTLWIMICAVGELNPIFGVPSETKGGKSKVHFTVETRIVTSFAARCGI